MKKSGGKSNAAAADVSFQQLVDLFGAHISLYDDIELSAHIWKLLLVIMNTRG